MRFSLILEDEAKFQNEIVQTLVKIDPEIQIRIFVSLEEFVEWIKLVMQEGAKAIAKAGRPPEGFEQKVLAENEEVDISVIVARVEFLGARQFGLLNKTREFFLKRKLCNAENPTAFVLTAFEDPLIKVRELRNRILANLIFKPFDRLILFQHLVNAIDGHKPPSQSAFEQQKFSAAIEMLKDVPVTVLSELGMLTRSSREIKPGATAKYYGSAFAAGAKRSVMARTVECKPHPDFPNEFEVTTAFFGLENDQISAIRRKLSQPATASSKSWIHRSDDREPVNFLMIEPEDETRSYFVDGFKNRFKNTEFVFYQDLVELLLELDPKSVPQEAMPKAFEKGNEIDFEFDSAARVMLNSSQPTAFGVSLDVMRAKPNWFQNRLDEKSKASFRNWLQNPATAVALKLLVGDKTFFVKPVAFQKTDKKISIKLQEMSQAERMEYIKSSGRLPAKVDFFVVSNLFFEGSTGEKWKLLKELIQNRTLQKHAPHLIMLSGKKFTDDELRSFSEPVSDIFFKPIDRVYVFKKLSFLCPLLRISEEELKVTSLQWNDTIKAASPAKTTEVTEAGLGLSYNRSIELGEFREFLLWTPYEIDSPELWAQCNYVEENPAEKGSFNCQFVFFGVSDPVLKAVRIWIRDNYIATKEQAG